MITDTHEDTLAIPIIITAPYSAGTTGGIAMLDVSRLTVGEQLRGGPFSEGRAGTAAFALEERRVTLNPAPVINSDPPGITATGRIVNINGTPALEFDVPNDIAAGTYELTATTSCGVVSNTFELRVNSNDATLSSLTVQCNTMEYVLSPAFSASNSIYTVTVPHSTTSVDITAITAYASMTGSWKGTELQTQNNTFTLTGLQVGENIFTVAVISENMNTTRNYTISIVYTPLTISIPVEGLANEFVSIPFAISNVNDVCDLEFTLVFNSNEFALVSASEFSLVDVYINTMLPHIINNHQANVTITSISHANGFTTVVFVSNQPAQQFKGIVNSVKLRPLQQGLFNVTCSVRK